MPLTSSGQIDLNAMHVEAGGTSGTECTLNDTDIRDMISKASGAQMAFNEWYGASSSTTYTFYGSDYIAQSNDVKFGGPHAINCLGSQINGAWNNAMTFSGSYSNLIIVLRDVHTSSAAGLYFGYNYASSLKTWTQCTGNNFSWNGNVTAKFYYNNSLIDTWTYRYDSGLPYLQSFYLTKNSSANTSLIGGSRTSASSWKIEVIVP